MLLVRNKMLQTPKAAFFTHKTQTAGRIHGPQDILDADIPLLVRCVLFDRYDGFSQKYRDGFPWWEKVSDPSVQQEQVIFDPPIHKSGSRTGNYLLAGLTIALITPKEKQRYLEGARSAFDYCGKEKRPDNAFRFANPSRMENRRLLCGISMSMAYL